MQVNILEAKNRLSELLKCAQAGEEVIIANRGRPVMRLVPIDAEVNIDLPIDSGAGLVQWLEATDARGASALNRDADQIEADIQEARNAWD